MSLNHKTHESPFFLNLYITATWFYEQWCLVYLVLNGWEITHCQVIIQVYNSENNKHRTEHFILDIFDKLKQSTSCPCSHLLDIRLIIQQRFSVIQGMVVITCCISRQLDRRFFLPFFLLFPSHQRWNVFKNWKQVQLPLTLVLNENH